MNERKASRWGRLADWVHRSPAALWLIGAFSFLEATVVPLPLELVLVPFLHKRRHQTWRVALIVTLACLAGAALLYGASAFFLESLGDRLIGWFSESGQDVEAVREMIRMHGFWALLLIAVTPMPFQLGILMAGAVQYPFGWFMLSAAIARGIRYFGLAWLVKRYGERTLELWRNHRVSGTFIAAGVVVLLWLIGRVVANWLTGLAG